MEDKEAQEKIAIILATYNLPREPNSNSSGVLLKMERKNCAKHILVELGYRKLPKDKPPLLADNPYPDEPREHIRGGVHTAFEEGKQAQREADIKHYGGE